MKYPHIIAVHLPQGRASFADYEDQNKLNLTDDVVESAAHPDGSCLLLFSTIDHLLRFRLEKEITGATVFPHHFSNKPIGDKHAKLLAHYGVTAADLMEDALLKVAQAHKHYHFHPHALN